MTGVRERVYGGKRVYGGLLRGSRRAGRGPVPPVYAAAPGRGPVGGGWAVVRAGQPLPSRSMVTVRSAGVFPSSAPFIA